MIRADFDPQEYVPRLDGDGDLWVGNVRLGNVFSNDYFFD